MRTNISSFSTDLTDPMDSISATSVKLSALENRIAEELEAGGAKFAEKYGRRIESLESMNYRYFQLGKPDWNPLEAALREPAATATNNSPPYTTSPNSSSNTTKNLSIEDKKNIRTAYSTLKGPKWTLKCSGKIVEDCMQLVAEQGSCEQKFNFWEIRAYSNMPEILDLPSDMEEFIKGFEGMWGTCKTTSEGDNKDRVLRALEITNRKKVGTKVDLLYSTQLFEVGAMEAGASSDRSSTKNITELGLKCPKTLKAQLVEMERTNPDQINSVKSCGFVISGLYLQFVIADCPGGHVCRVTKLPDYY
ncbi:hypothetical protein INT45_004492 [Circinella minor]|uniref:Uncharacterized protein n=1 Tax=Circinella minor TaxID=1195481 RepID=A0A8H7S3G1_9FUNG|nr:hypothetical protein INT45_004492 [Circinella minor]